MTLRRLGVLQWTGLLVGGAAWLAQFVAGYGLTEARCGEAGARWGISNDPWQAGFMAVAVVVVLLAEAAAVTVLVRTRRLSFEDDPPPGRMRFLAVAAVLANGLFLAIVLLSGIASIVDVTCRQS
jgi:hypothetical protein